LQAGKRLRVIALDLMAPRSKVLEQIQAIANRILLPAHNLAFG
jgi:hypothetical protein